ncbi:repeat 7B-like [Octopus vulgaris]|uniref:Repeat 7B-like n=7 Tax=Octopus TaxID=6643 RepID=A0AA36AUQ3_OCTVU|nr:repeat 7B-like [Octopus vulgaris]
MAAKVKPSRLEAEIEKCRAECSWQRALEFVRQLVHKSPGFEYMVDFVMGECKLEEYLEKFPPCEKNISKAISELSEAETLFNRVIQGDNRFKFDAQLLLVKIHYCRGNYTGAYALLEKADIDNITIKSPSIRFLRILAEGYAIKGLCLERMPPATTSKFKAAEKEEKIIHYFEKAGDLALLHLQEQERSQTSGQLGVGQVSLAPVNVNDVGLILETAIQQAPILHIKNGKLSCGISRFRELLRAVESRYTQSLRQILSRQLAEVLLRGVCERTYLQLDLSSENSESKSGNTAVPRMYAGDKLFTPANENEEALLLLLIAEAIATSNVVLNRSPEHSEFRQLTFKNVGTVYDLLAIALVKRAHFTLLAESYERAMRFSFDEFHIWYQFANSLICTGKYSRAVLVLNECARQQPKNPALLLQAARICIEYLYQYNEGIDFAERAIAIEGDHPLRSRIYVMMGVGYSMKANDMKMQEERQKQNRNAMNAFYKAFQEDPNDFLASFHLALQLAIQRQISDAVHFVRNALKQCSDHIHSLHLLVLLLSAQKHYEEAVQFLETALQEYPENISLLLTKARLEEVCLGPEEALVTCKHMLKLWKDLHEIHQEDGFESQSRGHIDRTAFDKRSLAQMQLNEVSDRDSAELYLSLDRTTEAESCVQETSAIFPLSYQVAFMKGRVLEHKKRFQEAKVYFENAISINPGHVKSLEHLGNVLHNLGNDRMAEKVLREAVNADTKSHQSWYCLGQVLHSLGQYEAASDCLQFAMDLEANSPIIPFTVIPRLLH